MNVTENIAVLCFQLQPNIAFFNMSTTSKTASLSSFGTRTTLKETPPKMISFSENTLANRAGLELEIAGLAEEKEKTKAAENVVKVLALQLKAAQERERQAKEQLAQGEKERVAHSLQLKSLEKRQKVSDQNQKTLMKTISENKDISTNDFASNMQASNKKMAKTIKSAQTRKRVSTTECVCR